MQRHAGENEDTGPTPPPQSIETMLFSVEVAQSPPPAPVDKAAATTSTVPGSHHATYGLTISFGFLTTWTVHRRYSEARKFAKALRSIVHASATPRCTEVSDELVAILQAGLPSSHRFLHLLQPRAKFVATRALALQSFVEALLNAHARCIMECASSSTSDPSQRECELVQLIQAFLGMDSDPSILQNIGGYLKQEDPVAPASLTVEAVMLAVVAAPEELQMP